MSVDRLEGCQKGIHWPYCIDSNCPGCMPDLPPSAREYEVRQTGLDLTIFRKDV